MKILWDRPPLLLAKSERYRDKISMARETWQEQIMFNCHKGLLEIGTLKEDHREEDPLGEPLEGIHQEGAHREEIHQGEGYWPEGIWMTMTVKGTEST